MKTPSSRGFTLVELLVVIAIVGVLAALAMGALGRARVRAKDVACVNNMRSIGIALHSYAADNRQVLPYINGQPTYNAALTLASKLVGHRGAAGYLPWNGDSSVTMWTDVMLCGADPNADLYRNIAFYPSSYEYRQNQEAADGTNTNPISLLTRLPRQEGYNRWILRDRGILGAAGLKKPFRGGSINYATPAERWPQDRYGYGSYWHEGGTNVLYEDGSVSFRRIDQSVTM